MMSPSFHKCLDLVWLVGEKAVTIGTVVVGATFVYSAFLLSIIIHAISMSNNLG